MSPDRFLEAARVPSSLQEQSFGPWTIERRLLHPGEQRAFCGWPTQTILWRTTLATMHLKGEIVMDDSKIELSRHLPIWMTGTGRILITGLGLGCAVRGLLAKPEVEHIDVVELDADILRVVGAEFAGEQRCTLHHGDALTIELPGRWDFAWHDLWCEGGGAALQLQHAELYIRFRDRAARQGAWAFPREIARLMGARPINAPNKRRLAA